MDAKTTDRSRESWRTAARWLPFLAAFLLEFWLFDRVGSRRYTWVYPRWNDQVQYLTEAYTGWIDSQSNGLVAALGHILGKRVAQGTLHDFLAVLVFRVAGGSSRSAALALNMLAMIAWQAALSAAAWRRSGLWSLACIAAALPLALAWPWNDLPGSAVDFRLDHLAMCSLGVCLACGWMADGFRSARGSAAFGAAAGITVLIRFITAVYLAPVFAVLLLCACVGPDQARRLWRGLLAAMTGVALAGWALWINRQVVWSYYWVVPETGPEHPLRDFNLGFVNSLDWLGQHLAVEQLGTFLGLMAFGAAALLTLGILIRGRRPAEPPGGAVQLALLGALFLIASATALAVHNQKSQVVVSAMVPGALAIILAILWALLRRSGAAWRALAASAVAAASCVHFIVLETAPAFEPGFERDARKVDALADVIYARSCAAEIPAPRVAVDHVSSPLDGLSLRVVCFERHGVWMPFFVTLPTGLIEEKESVLLDQVSRSDFVFVTDAGIVGPWPFDREMRALGPRVRAWCEANFRRAEQFTLFGRRMTLYQRREIPFP